jgi:hypothetical protein
MLIIAVLVGWVPGLITGWVLRGGSAEAAEWRREEQLDAERDARRRGGAP